MPKWQKSSSYIPVRIASTGSKLEAFIAGKIPETNPIAAAITVPIIILKGDKTNSKSGVNAEAMRDATNTKSNPIIPPINARIMASNKN